MRLCSLLLAAPILCSGQGVNTGHTNIAFYTFEDNNLFAADFSGNNNSIASYAWYSLPPYLTNDSAYGTNAVGFTGSGWLVAPGPVADSLEGSFSVSVWLRTTNVFGANTETGDVGAGIIGGESDMAIPMAETGSVLGFLTEGNPADTLHSVTPINSGSYTHVVVTRDQATGQKNIYINGNLDASDVGVAGQLSSASRVLLNIGEGVSGPGYVGDSDQIGFYTGVLSQSDVTFLYNHPGLAVPDTTNSAPTPIALGDAVNSPQLPWTTYGDSLWFGEASNSFDGVSAAQSGPVINNQTSTIQTFVTSGAGGALTFQWQTSPNGQNLDFEFAIDGSDTADIGPGTSWTQFTINVPAGRHMLTWTVQANGDTDPTEAGYLDQVSFLPSSGESGLTGGHTLVAHYTFDNSSNLGQDSSGNGYDLDYSGNPYGGGVFQDYPAEAGDGAAYFDGGSFLSYTATPPAVLSVLAGNFTLSVWVKTTERYGNDGDPAYNDVGIVAADIPGQYNDIIPLGLTGGGLGFETGDTYQDDTLSSTTDIDDGNYHQIVVERNQATGEKWIFIDGVFNNTDFATTNYLNDPVLVAVGCMVDASNPNPSTTSTTGFYYGDLDDLQLYSGLLTTNEVATLYSNPGSIAPSSSGLIAHYTFDNSTNIGADTSGNGNDLNYNGNPSGNGVSQSSTAEVGGGAAYFDGGSFLSYNSTPTNVLNTFAGSFTLSFWINTSQTFGGDGESAYSGAGIVAADIPGQYDDIVPAALDGGEIGFNTGSSQYDDTLNTDRDINDGNYHHIAITRDQVSGQKQIYIDGSLDTSDSATTDLLNAPVSLAVGCQIDASVANPANASTANFFQGLLDDMQLYSRVLGPTEIAYLYANPGQTTTTPSDFNTALNTTNLGWATTGDASWFVESTNTYDGMFAAQSGVLTNGQYSTIQVTVSGPNTVTFWWQTTGQDYLEFNVDGDYIDSIYGYTPWTQSTPYVLSPGPHTLGWTSYWAGNSDDTGYLDQVTFSGVYPPQVSGPSGGGTIAAGSDVVLTAQVLANPPATIEWLHNGNVITNATNATLVINNAQVSDSGNYQLIASNSLGTADSGFANLTIYLPTDLEAVSLNAPSVIGSQQTISLVWTATNTGPATAGGYYDIVYLESNGVFVTSFSHYNSGPILPATAYSITDTFVFPGIPAGNYTLSLFVDYGTNVPGDSGVNDTLSGIPLTVQNPDLQPTALQATNLGLQSEGVQFTYTVANNGPGPANMGYFYNYFYISTNPVWDSTATLIGYIPAEFTYTSTNLNAGQQITYTNVLTPAVLPSGNYYYILVVNGSHLLYESDTTNNQISVPVQLTVADLVPENLTAPTNVSGLEPATVTWTDKNIGDAVAESRYTGALEQWYDSLYLSTNQAVNVLNSVEIGSIYYDAYYEPTSYSVANPVQPGQSVTNTQMINIPEVAAGNYYLVVWANQNNQVAEYDLSNDFEAIPITVLPQDMAVASFTVPAAADSRDTIPVIWQVTNDSSGSISGWWTDKVYISPDPQLDSQAVLLGSFLETNELAANTNYVASNSVALPGLSPGNYYMLLEVNALGNIIETNTSNNFVSVPIAIGSPDLAAQSLVVPTNLSSQEPLSVVYSVGNISGVEALPGWLDQLFLSKDGILETNNILMGTSAGAGPLAVGSSYTNLFTTAVPGVPAGNYYILLDADANSFFAEPNLANNVETQEVQISNPDLTPTNFSSPAVVSITQLNQQIDLNWSVANIGAGTAYPSWTDYIYLSPTNVLDSNATLVDGEEYESVVGPSQSYINFRDLTLPNGILGNLFLIVDVNGDHSLYETNYTNNNTIARPIQLVLPPTPILSVLSVGAPTDAWSGQSITVTWVLTNAGTGPVQGTFYDQVFLASDAFGDNPQFFGSYPFTGEIPAGGSVTRNALINLPINFSGTYWAEVQTDVNQDIFQYIYRTNETLVAASPTVIHLTPTAQLEVASIQAPTNLFSGDPANVSFVVTNVGSGPTSASYWSDAVFISQLTNYNIPNFFEYPGDFGATGAIFLGSAQNSSYLNPGQAYENSVAVTIPEGLEGTYYFIVRTDDQDQVFETNRSGSILVSAPVQIDLTPPPDLQITSIIAPHEAFSGQPVSLEWSATNVGLGQTIVSTWYDQVFLSTNSVLDPSAVSLGQFIHSGALDPNAGYTATNTVSLPIGISGNWYFIVKVDSQGAIYEGAFQNLNVTNPGYSTAVALTPPPDLVTTILQSPSNSLASHTLAVTYSVFNEGATATPNIQSAWNDTLYISTNSVLDSTAMTMTIVQHSGALQPGAGYTNVISTVLPNGLTGTYYIYVRADSQNQVFELNKTNNLARAVVPTVVSEVPADLAVLYLQAPPSGITGGSVLVNWAVTNRGPGDSAVTSWVDQLILSRNPVLGSPSDQILLDVNHTGLLGAGQTYADTNESAGIPITVAPGQYYFFLVADVGNSVYEGTNANTKTYGPVPFTVTSDSADLDVTTATAPTSAYAGSTIPVSFTIKNIGSLSPNANSWVDGIYLTTNGLVADPTTVTLGYAYNVSTLPPGTFYTNTVNVPLPANDQGQYYVVVVADAGNNVSEPGLKGNNTYIISPPINITLGPVPDLVVTNLIVPSVAYEGQPFTATWTVQNIGPVAAKGAWLDAAYLSLDQTVDFGVDTYVGSVPNVTNLAPGASYTNTASFVIPQGYAGPYYVSITADFGKSLSEREDASNTTFSAEAMEVELLPPVDLITGTIIIPTNADLGQNMTVTYSVFNTGSNAAIGSWEDAIYISPTTNFSINDPLFATVQHTGTVPPQTGYTNTVTAPVPGVLPGQYYVIVHSDILNSIPETDVSNTIASSPSTVDATIDQLTLGTPVNGALSAGQSAYYSFYATNGQTILIQLNSADPLSGNELFVSEGAIPGLSQFDYAADDPFVASPYLYIPITNSGTYYLTVYGQYESLPESYTLLAQVVPFSVGTVQPTFGGDQGPTTFFVQGALFDSKTSFVLMNPTNSITNTSLILQDSSAAYVTFDLSDQPDGLYNLLAITGGTNQVTASLNGAVTVEPGIGADDVYSIVGPEAVGEPDYKTVIHPMSIAYGNAGDSDSAPPLILVDGEEGTLIGMTPYTLGPLEVELLGRNQAEPVTILRPQNDDTVQMYFFGPNQHSQAQIILPTSIRPMAPTDWQTIEASVRPTNITDASWNAFWGNIQPRIGSTWGDYVQFLDNIALQFPPDEVSVAAMIGDLYTNSPNFQASETVSGTLLGDADQAPQAGVTVGFYQVQSNGSYELQNSATTDQNGQYTVPLLPPGQYTCAVDSSNSQFDMNLTGNADMTPPTFNLTNDLPNQTIYVYQPPPLNLPTNDLAPTLITDNQGVLHNFWYRNDYLWHAWSSNGTWVGAAPITTNFATGFAVASSSKLVNAQSPGLITVWAQDGTNGQELYYSVSETATNGAYQWSQSIMLTDDAVQNSSPAVVVRPDGLVVITYLKRGYGFTDDSDVYYSVVNVTSGSLLWNEPSGDVQPKLGGGGTTDFSTSAAINVAYSKSFNCFGNVLSAGASLAGNVGVTGCTGSGGVTGGISLSGQNADIALQAAGSGNINYVWDVDPNYCGWAYNSDASTGNIGFGISGTAKNAAFKILKAFPPITTFVTILQETITDMGKWMGVEFENNLTIGGQLGVNACHWKDAPLTTFSLPSKFANTTCDMTASVALGIKVPGAEALTQNNVPPPQNQIFTAGGPSSKVGFTGSATADLKFELYPNFLPLSLTFGGNFALNFGGWVFNYPIIIPPITINDPTTSPELRIQPRDDFRSLPGWTVTYDPSSATGTTNVYGTNAVLSTVATDLYNDGAPALAVDGAGAPYQVWYKEGNPYTQIGSQIYVADYNGSTWNAPVLIPGSLGFNSYVSAATDNAGNRLAVWVRTDTSGLTTNATAAQLYATRNGGDVSFSTFDGSSWSAPQVVAATPGLDADLKLSAMANGNILAVWTYTDTNSVQHLVSSSWNGASWTALDEITSGSLNTPTAQQIGNTTVVLWTALEDTNGDTSLYESDNSGGVWSKPAPFIPALLNPAPGSQVRLAAAPKSVAPKFSFDFGVNPNCCKCGGKYTPPVPQPLCPIATAIYDYTNCVWNYTYKPCVVHPRDPNDLIGPAGYGPQQWVPASSPLNYTIEFENDPTLASAPAQQVNITLPLDPNLDPQSFRLGSFGFGGLYFTPPPNSAFYQTQIDLTASEGFYVDVFAGVNVSTGQAFWTFTTIDPKTGNLPANPLVGFLPPDTNAPNGEGFVEYSVSATSTDPTGTVVTAQASITFNGQPPLSTVSVFNTIETGLPLSAVLPLPAETVSSTFDVAWTGTNAPGGLGIASYDIYFSENGAPYAPWLQGTTLNESAFTGQPGNSYAFYSIAHDSAGNVQPTPSVPDAVTFISTNRPPIFAANTNVIVTPDGTVAVPIQATDPNGNLLTYSLVGGPSGAAISEVGTNVVFTWTPTRAYADTTNVFAVAATDNGLPPLSATQTVTVIVLDYLQLSVGSTNVESGQSANVPITLSSSGGVTNLSFTLQLPESTLSNLSVQAIAPQISTATLLDRTTNVLITLSTLPAQSLTGTQAVLQLNFTAKNSPPSLFVSLLPTNIIGFKLLGAPYTNYISQAGTVAVVQNQPLLTGTISTNQTRTLVLYGKLGATYQLQYNTNLNTANWQPLLNYMQSNGVITINLVPTNAVVFYRLQQQ